MKKYLFFTIILLLSGCASQKHITKSINEFPELNIFEDGTELRYSITTHVYQGDEIGEIQNISGYRVFFIEKQLDNGNYYYHFYKIEKASAVNTIEEIKWENYENIDEFKVIVNEENELDSSKNYLDQIPHDSMETYNIYVSLMDILMYHRYARLAKINLNDRQKIYEIEPVKSQAANWEPIIKNIIFEETPTYLYEIENDNNEISFFYKNDGTKIYQTIYLGILRVPSVGTTRFMGFIKINNESKIQYASLSEYFSMKIWPLFFMKMNMLVRREQELIQIE